MIPNWPHAPKIKPQQQCNGTCKMWTELWCLMAVQASIYINNSNVWLTKNGKKTWGTQNYWCPTKGRKTALKIHTRANIQYMSCFEEKFSACYSQGNILSLFFLRTLHSLFFRREALEKKIYLVFFKNPFTFSNAGFWMRNLWILNSLIFFPPSVRH